MDTTMKVSAKTKARLNSLPLAQKGKTYDALINELVTSYERSHESASEASRQDVQRQRRDASKSRIAHREAQYEALLAWARQKGFKD